MLILILHSISINIVFLLLIYYFILLKLYFIKINQHSIFIIMLFYHFDQPLTILIIYTVFYINLFLILKINLLI